MFVKPVTSLYVHVPFCARKCAYCAFFSEVGSDELIERYVGALLREMELVADDLKPRTVFFGGGTPSILSLGQWERIFQGMGRLNLLGAKEWTVECNPATVSLDKARLLCAGGVNRASLGAQSFDDSMLERLGRLHNRRQVVESFEILRHAGFDNLSLDLMFAIPGQSLEIWRDTLTQALALGSEHLSSYEIIYEEDTPLFAQLNAGDFTVDEDLASTMYEELIVLATGSGLEQYEVANFARHAVPDPPSSNLTLPSRSCRHNVNYWRGGSFYGLGPSATSYVRGRRTKNVSNTRLYCEQLEKGNRAIESHEELSALARAGETAAFGLRMLAGWQFDEFRQTTGHDLRDEWSGDMRQMVETGWGRMTADGFHLTRQGLLFADAAAKLFLR